MHWTHFLMTVIIVSVLFAVWLDFVKPDWGEWITDKVLSWTECKGR